MEITLYIADAILALLLIVVVLLQSSKSSGLSGAIGGGAEVLLGGKRKGLDEVLAKLTIGIAVVFGIVTLVLVKLTQF